MISRRDFYPYGEQISGVGGRSQIPSYNLNHSLKQKFTGKERDEETGLDFFEARYYSAKQAKFTSTDPKIIPSNLSEVQLWNSYAYSFNNPLRFIDPDGQEPQEGAEARQNRDVKDLMEGRMTREEFQSRQNARVKGTVIGTIGAAAIIIGSRNQAILGSSIGQALIGFIARNAPTIQQIGNEAVQMSTGNPAPAATTSLERQALIKMSEEVFERSLVQEVTRTAENIGGFKIFGSKGLVGNVFNRNVFLIEAEKKGASSLSGLVKNLEDEARSAGAKELRIIGTSIVNTGFFNAKIAKRFGFTFRRINNETIELSKKLDGN
ncbi:MAG: RHS repeat-associated core domain-containing protein [Blastocatellia bacterium]|nr:RHS repeat-associated core domain-containing protein [Blastocatellia bacterium]